LLGDIVTLKAFELEAGVPQGYQVQVMGASEIDLFKLLGQLVLKLRATLRVQHMQETQQHGTQFAGATVRGGIEWDEAEQGRVPTLVVDGQQIRWHQFGHVLMTREGWQFRLQIRDPSDHAA